MANDKVLGTFTNSLSAHCPNQEVTGDCYLLVKQWSLRSFTTHHTMKNVGGGGKIEHTI